MRRIALSLCLLVAASCGGNSNSRSEGGSGGSAGNGGEAGDAGRGGSDTGGHSGGSGGKGGAAGDATGGTGDGGANGGSPGVDAATDSRSGGGSGRDGGSTAADSKPGPDAAPPSGGAVYVYVGGVPATITVFKLDLGTGALTKVGTANGGTGPTWMNFSSDKKFLYATNEYASPSKVGGFAIDQATGALKAVGSFVTTQGEGAAFIAVHPSGKWVVSPAYDNGHLSVFSVKA